MKTFDELKLISPVRRALADEKYETPTPIQASTVPAALLGRDVLGCAQTGTGKTAAFALPILNRLGQQKRQSNPNRPFALVLAPTRELASQIRDSLSTYGKHLRFRHALVHGGVSQLNQVRAMNRGAHILVATPGRLLDLMDQGHIKLNRLELFVLDEADRMLDMGFLPDLKRIITQLPARRQSLFFSATLPPKITELSERLLRHPVRINVTPKARSVESVEQKVVFVERCEKQALLRRILESAEVDRAIVFTRTKRGANVVTQRLVRDGINATAIHGDKTQAARQRALSAFRRKQVRVLVATDVAARGIDVDGITHVVNFDMPHEPESYIHRIGRTGRAGAEGVALSFCSDGERGELRAIEKLIGRKLSAAAEYSDSRPRGCAPVPSRGRRDAANRRMGSRRSGSRAAAKYSSTDSSKDLNQSKRRRRSRANEAEATRS